MKPGAYPRTEMTTPASQTPRIDIPSGVNPEILVAGLVTEPTTGIAIARLSGELIYANDQAARIFVDARAKASDFVGRSMWTVFPDAWMRERVEIGRRMYQTGRPTLMRTVWLGYQVLSWIYPLDLGGEEDAARVLVISRRVPAGGLEATAMGDVDVVESRMVRLGELDVLSPRELEVLALVGQGLSIKEIAEALHRSEKTIQNHRDSIGSKLGLSNRVKVAEVARLAALTRDDAGRSRV